MILRSHDHNFIGHKIIEIALQANGRKGDHSDIQRAVYNQIFQRSAVLFRDLYVNAWVGAPEFFQDAGQKTGSAERADSQIDPSAVKLLDIPDLIFGTVVVHQNLPGMADENLACGRRTDAACRAYEEFGAKLRFILKQKLAQAGLGHIEFISGAGNTSLIRNHDNIIQFLQVHRTGKVLSVFEKFADRAIGFTDIAHKKKTLSVIIKKL